ncbi:MAG TPA: GDP-mannose 4,6-dehydratase [Dehalococcoidia bacterium]|nr:GDP-mannose 4,6-dehydratase [Dehalococcoidia bacterium]
MDRATFMVTGGAGFLGSHLIEALLALGHRVLCFDRLDPRATWPSEMGWAVRHPGLRVACGDLMDAEALRGAVAGHQVRAVAHLAAQVNLRASVENPGPYVQVNVLGTVNVLQACAGLGVRRVVLASSDSVYGPTESVPIGEEQALRPLSPYAASKVAAEQFAHAFAHVHGLSVVALRLFSPYGPRQRPGLAVSSFVEKVARGDEVTVYGDGTQCRDFTYVSDVVRALVLALQAPLDGFQAINVSGGRPVTIMELMMTIAEALGCRPKVRHLPSRPDESPTLWADLTRAHQLLGYQPQVTLEQGVQSYVRWWLDRHRRPAQAGGRT